MQQNLCVNQKGCLLLRMFFAVEAFAFQRRMERTREEPQV